MTRTPAAMVAWALSCAEALEPRSEADLPAAERTSVARGILASALAALDRALADAQVIDLTAEHVDA